MADVADLKLPPHSVEAEQSLIGGLLIDNRAMAAVQRVVRSADFYACEHSRIWAVMAEQIGAGGPADVITVFEALQQRGQIDETLNLGYLNALAQSVPSAANAKAYADIVAHAARRRRLMRLGQDIAAKAQGGNGTQAEFAQVLAWVQDEVSDIAQGASENEPRPIGELLPAWMDEIQARADGKVDALPTGLASLDRRLYGGMRRGDLIVLGARPSMGKSAFTLGVMRAVAQQLPVLVCTMEDSAHMLISRQIASVTRTPFEHVRMPQHAPESLWDAVSDGCNALAGLRLWIDERAGLALADVVDAVVRVRAKAGDCALVVVDYLQLMEDDGETRAYELAAIARGLKNMAKRMGCAVLLLSQLSRKADETNAPPRLDHLAESGAIEQAADVIALLWREARRNQKADANKAQIELVKHKNGATDTVQLFFDGRTQRFADLAEEGSY